MVLTERQRIDKIFFLGAVHFGDAHLSLQQLKALWLFQTIEERFIKTSHKILTKI